MSSAAPAIQENSLTPIRLSQSNGGLGAAGGGTVGRRGGGGVGVEGAASAVACAVDALDRRRTHGTRGPAQRRADRILSRLVGCGLCGGERRRIRRHRSRWRRRRFQRLGARRGSDRRTGDGWSDSRRSGGQRNEARWHYRRRGGGSRSSGFSGFPHLFRERLGGRWARCDVERCVDRGASRGRGCRIRSAHHAGARLRVQLRTKHRDRVAQCLRLALDRVEARAHPVQHDEADDDRQPLEHA